MWEESETTARFLSKLALVWLIAMPTIIGAAFGGFWGHALGLALAASALVVMVLLGAAANGLIIGTLALVAACSRRLRGGSR